MNESNPCGLECTRSCGGAGAAACPGAGPVRYADVLPRFDREAVRDTLDTGRYRMPYFVWGSGPPLLFIHGVCDGARSFLLPVSRLSAHFRCVAYDLPTGRGDGASLRRYTHADLVDDVWALLDHLGVNQSYVHATSFGSTVALAALHQHPGRLPRAVLQGPMAHRALGWGERALARLGRFLPGRMARLPLRKRLLHWINGDAFAGLPPEVWQNFLDYSGEAPIASLSYQVLMLDRLDLRPLLPEVRQPVLLVHGEQDRVVPFSFVEVLLRGLPNARCAVLEGCGHVPSYTHPEVLAEVIRQFLTPRCPGEEC